MVKLLGDRFEKERRKCKIKNYEFRSIWSKTAMGSYKNYWKREKKTRNAEVPIVLNDSNFYWHYCEVAYAVDKDQEKHLERFLFVLT